MKLVPAICTQCGAKIEVDGTQKTGICQYCGTAFITEQTSNHSEDGARIEFGGLRVSKAIGERLKYLVARGEIVKAVKELREAEGLGLKEAKDAIDAYRGW